MTVWTIADRGSLIFEEKFRPKILTDMKRPDFIPDNRSGTDNKTASGSRTRVIIRIIGIGILCLISVAIMALVIWINIRSRLN
jgi:hypothetical protein